MALHELENGQILLLGEGDFSFTVAFIHQLQPNVKVTATCLLSSTHLRQLHPAAEENVDFLLSKGIIIVRFSIMFTFIYNYKKRTIVE